MLGAQAMGKTWNPKLYRLLLHRRTILNLESKCRWCLAKSTQFVMFLVSRVQSTSLWQCQVQIICNMQIHSACRAHLRVDRLISFNRNIYLSSRTLKTTTSVIQPKLPSRQLGLKAKAMVQKELHQELHSILNSME